MSNILFGSVPIIPTPFTVDESIDEAALRNLIEFAISSGLQAVCLPASVSLINELRLQHANFKYLKLEEPLCAPKFEEIIAVTEGKVSVFEGWGGIVFVGINSGGHCCCNARLSG